MKVLSKARQHLGGFLLRHGRIYSGVRDLLEHEHQAKIEKAVEGANPDFAATTTEAQALLADYDKAIDMVAKAPPISPVYDEVTRLRIVRSHLREVPPALKAGNFAKARKSFEEFDNTWGRPSRQTYGTSRVA
jgi:hypothetical protein